ncbi:hypothetical protein IL306_013518 [Fusarium sp. DS 682]|nr:hypothetical protein IL306_013518 [Fusarium sp. DS 682]
MTLHTESYTVTKENKSFPNALDICYPFIEDGPRGSVVFIHSTVPQFLLDHTYGPVVEKTEVYRDISVACLGQLLQSLYLATEQPGSSEVHHQTVHGFHALLPYVVEYWAEHVLDYLEMVPEAYPGRQSQVMKKLLQLCDEHGRISISYREKQLTAHLTDYKPSKEDKRLESLRDFPAALALVKSFTEFKEIVNATKGM